MQGGLVNFDSGPTRRGFKGLWFSVYGWGLRLALYRLGFRVQHFGSEV
jgi:hypothetical protein